MRNSYNFSNARKNPYASQLKRPITIRLDEGSIAYFKGMADETGIPYQSLINLYLKECAATKKRLNMVWSSGETASAA
jgi:predicted DNA binding CopG/RHH family protein